jgi:hypothetical protein
MELVNIKTGTDSFVGEDGKPETKDQYPWGLRITLDNESLQRLGLNAKSLPAVGDSVQLWQWLTYVLCLPHHRSR